jgi:hypothetical protein
MRRSRRDVLKMAAVTPAAVLAGCNLFSGKSGNGTTGGKQPGTCVLCHKCGEIKGSDKCCKPGAEKCAKCGLDKGSPGCCRLAGAKGDVCLCTYCGEIKGSDKCCKPGAEKCTKCGLDKGSPGCCRIKREDKPVM